MNSKIHQIEWRRAQVFELTSKGYNQSEIAKILQVDKSIVSRDIAYLKGRSKENISKYVDEKLPEEYEKCLIGLTAILKEAWSASKESSDKREKIQALSLAKDCYAMKLELLTNATVIDNAIRFVSNNVKGKGKDNDQVERHKARATDEKIEDCKYDIQGSKENNSIRNSTYNKIF